MIVPDTTCSQCDVRCSREGRDLLKKEHTSTIPVSVQVHSISCYQKVCTYFFSVLCSTALFYFYCILYGIVLQFLVSSTHQTSPASSACGCCALSSLITYYVPQHSAIICLMSSSSSSFIHFCLQLNSIFQFFN